MPNPDGSYTEAEKQWFAQFAAMTPEQQAQVRAQEAANGPAADVGGVTAPAATPAADTTTADNKATYQTLASYLTDMGLGELLQLDASGNPTGWLWDQITNGIDSPAMLQINLEATPAFDRRYGVIKKMRQRAAAGENVYVPSVSEVRQYEQSSAQIMRQAGLPGWFYDSYTDSQDLMAQGLSVSELEQRLGASWERVQSTPPEVRQAFSQFYGIEGDSALAAFYLDKTHTQAKLDQVSRAAYTAGMGRTVGLDLNQQVAERIAQLPTSDAGIMQNLTDVSSLAGSGVFTEGITETQDLTANNEGINSVVFGDGGARARLERRTLARQANSRSSTGGAALTNTGLAVGSA